MVIFVSAQIRRATGRAQRRGSFFMMLSGVILIAGRSPALTFGDDDRRSDGSGTSWRHETAPEPVKVLDRSVRNLSRDQSSSKFRRAVTSYPQDTLSRLQKARIVLVSGELMIALCKSRCEQTLVGNSSIFPCYQERCHQVGRCRPGSVGRRVRHVSMMDHDCSFPIDWAPERPFRNSGRYGPRV